MTAQASKTIAADRKEIARLVGMAAEAAVTDGYTGKRRTWRWSCGLPLEVTTNPDDPLAAWPVTMHDVSHFGVSFWSRKNLPANNAIYVRAYASDARRPWLPAHVKHRTQCLRGYLIGAEFDTADSPHT